jgi:hypothetical protein
MGTYLKICVGGDGLQPVWIYRFWPMKFPSGAKAQAHSAALAARLKSCPVTKLRQIAAELSFFAACKARVDIAGVMCRLLVRP